MDLLEKVKKNNEEKKAQLTKVPSVVTGLGENKGNGLMEYHRQETVSQ